MTEMIENKIVKLMSVASTNNYAIEYIKKNDWQEGTVIFTTVQNQGKGQVNNTWESEPRKNILISILLSPNFLPIIRQFQISKIAALTVYDIVSAFAPNTAIKWPNDIYIGTKKVAGILIENSIMGNKLKSTVVGIGLNVNQVVFESDAPNPISLKQVIGIDLKLDEVLENLINRFNAYYDHLIKGSLDIDSEYINKLYRYQTKAKYEDSEGRYNGIITGVNEIGQLQIRKDSGELMEYHFKEVKFL